MDSGAAFTGGAGNDAFIAAYDSVSLANTLTILDQLDGGAGTDTLSFSQQTNAPVTVTTGAKLSNIEVVTLRAGDDLKADFSGTNVSGLTTISVLQAVDADITAAKTASVSVEGATGAVTITGGASQTVTAGAAVTVSGSEGAVSISGAKGAITVDGGSTVTVSDATADQNITIGDTTESTGSVTVIDTKQGTGVITVEGGTDVTVTATVAGTTTDVTGGAINVGNKTDQPTGAIKVTQNNTGTGAFIAGTLEVHTLTITPDDIDDGNETLTIQYDNNGNEILNGTVVVNNPNIDFTDASAVAAAAAALIDADPHVTATSNGAVITITQTILGDSIEPTAVAGGTKNGLAGTPATTTPGASTGYADVTAGAINVKGGSTIDIVVNSTSTAAAATADGDITNGTVTATAGDTTTTISVVQNNTETTVTKAAVDEVKGTSAVTFKAIAANQTIVVAGLTFTAAKNLTAQEVAQAFANLTAEDGQSNGSTANGTYSGDVDAGITTGSASGAVVVFTNTAGTAAPTLSLGGTGAAPTKVDTTGTAAVAEDKSGNTVTAGNVVLNDNAKASVTDITVTNFGTANLGLTDGFDKLVNLNLTNNTGAVALDTAGTSLTMNVNDIISTVTIDSGAATVTNLTINSTGKASDFDLTAAAVTDLKVTGDKALTLTGSTLTAVKNLTVSGAGGLVLGGANEAVTLVSVDASAASGAVTLSIAGNKATYKGSSGADTVTLTETAIDKSIQLNDGNDTLILKADSVTLPSVVINAGAGTDVLSMTDDSAAGLDGNTDFRNAVSGFERLHINSSLADAADINLENLGFTNYVITSGSAGTSTLSNLASGGTVEITDAATTALVVALKDAATGKADVLNVVLNAGAKDVKALTAANVETVNLSTDSKDDDTTLALNATSATSVTISGAGDVTLTTDNTSVFTTLDASAATGVITFVADDANAQTVKGGSGADKLTTSGNGDVIVGNGGNDQITIAAGDNIKIVGGAGSDKFTVTGSSSTDSVYAIFQAAEGDTTSVGVGAGDQFIFNHTVSNLATSFRAQEISLSLGATPSTQAYIAKALLDLDTDSMGWFQFGGNTFIVREGNTDGAYSAADGDQVVMIVGLIDLSTNSTFNTFTGILEITPPPLG